MARRFRPSLPMRRASSKCAVGAFLLPPQTTPRAFEATIAALTRSEISLASYSAMAARIWIVSSVGLRKIGGDELDAAFHELRDQGYIAGQAIELRYDQDGAEYAAKSQRLVELRAGGFRAALDLGELGEEVARSRLKESANRRLLSLEAQP